MTYNIYSNDGPTPVENATTALQNVGLVSLTDGVVTCHDRIAQSVLTVFTEDSELKPLLESSIKEVFTCMEEPFIVKVWRSSTFKGYNIVSPVTFATKDYANFPPFVPRLEAAIKACGKTGMDVPDGGRCFDCLGRIYDKVYGNFNVSSEWYKKALAIREAKLGTDHPSTATTYNTIGLAYISKGDYNGAIEW
jgi:hypothetical protein